MFSTKLKQMLYLILQYSAEEEGISSQKLGSVLWPGKPTDKVKNLRGVTINHLRKALSELDGVELIYEKGCFKIVQTSELYCDYTRCIEILAAEDLSANREELLGILARGKFLKFSDEEVFDTFKETVEQKLEPVLLLETEKSFVEEAYKTTIDLTEAIFNIDPLNDMALSYQIKAMQRLKMNEEAKLKYQSFSIEYKKIIGTSYPQSYKNLS
jgi:two-component SAPR family response regulator